MKKWKQLCSLLLVTAIVIGLCPVLPAAEAANAEADATYYLTDAGVDDVVISASGTYWVGQINPESTDEVTSDPVQDTITVKAGVKATIYLEDVNIDVSGLSKCAFLIEAGATVTLILSGTSTLKSGAGYAGIQVESGATLTIQQYESTGDTLSATGGAGAAGIGNGSDTVSGGVIYIEGGTIIAAGTASGATTAISIGGTGAVVIVTGGSLSASTTANISAGLKAVGGTWTMTGTALSIPANMTVPANTLLTVPTGSTLTIPSGVTLTVEGTLAVESGGKIVNSGSVILRDGSITYDNGELTGNAVKRAITAFSYKASVPTIALGDDASGLTVPQATASCTDYEEIVTGVWGLTGNTSVAGNVVILTLTFKLSGANCFFDEELVDALESGLSASVKPMVDISLSSDASQLIYTYTVTVDADPLPISAFSLKTLSYTYTGSIIEPEVVVDSTAGLGEGTDYMISYDVSDYPDYDNVNAGTGAVIIKGINNYSGTYRLEFTITKAASDIYNMVTVEYPKDSSGASKTAFSCSFNGSTHSFQSFGVTITADSSLTGLGTPTVYYNGAADLPTNVGVYTVTLKLPAGDNYEADSVTRTLGTITITKAAAPSAVNISIEVAPNNNVNTLDVSSYLPSNANPQSATITVTNTGNVVRGTPTFSSGILSYGTNSVAYGAKATIVLNVTMQNYENTTVTINMTVVFKTTVTFSGLAAASKTYDGYQEYVTAPTGTISGGGTYTGTIQYWYTGTGNTSYGPSTTAPKNVGTYTVYASISSSNSQYEGTSSKVSFSITQKELTISPEDVTIYLGKSLPNYYYLEYDGIVGGDSVTFSVSPILVLQDSSGKLVDPDTTESGVYNIVWTNMSTSVPTSSNYKITTKNTGTLIITLKASTTSTGNLVYTAGQLAGVDSISLLVDKDTMTDLVTDGKKLDMVTSFAELSFNATALAAVTKTSGATATITVSETTVSSLPQAARATLAGGLVYDFTVLSAAGKEISTFGDDTVTVSLTYYQRNSDKGIAVYHIDDDGGLTLMNKVTYDSTDYQVRFTASEFSSYAVVEVANPYSDVNYHWARSAINQAYALGLLSANAGDKFYPDDACTRGTLVTMLYRMAGSPEVKSYKLTFDDVNSDDWYADAVKWAATNGIVTGVSSTAFSPNSSVTRQEIAAILFRYAYYLGAGTEGTWSIKLAFTDKSQISSWAYEGATFCQQNSIISGKPGNLFAPNDLATRAEVATMLQRFISTAVNALYE